MVFAAYVVASRQYKIIFLGTQVPKCDCLATNVRKQRDYPNL